MNKRDLHTPTQTLEEENKKLRQLLKDVKKEYIDHINESAQREKVFSSFRLSVKHRDYLMKMGDGNITKGLRKVINDHMMCEGWTK